MAVADAVGDLELWCVDRVKGAVLWKAPLSGGNNRQRKQNMSSPSPVTDGTNVWVMTGTGILKAFDFAGKEIWARDIQKDYGAFGLNWGYASSPLLHEGALYVQVLHGMKTDDPSYVLKIDAKSGKTSGGGAPDRGDPGIARLVYDAGAARVRRQDRDRHHGGRRGDRPRSRDRQASYGASTASTRRTSLVYRIVASPVVAGGLVIAPTRVKPMLAIKPGGRGDVSATHTVWSFDRGPDVPTPVSDGTLLYSVDDRGIVHALDVKTGAVVYGPERLKPAIYSASPILADGKIYVTNEEGLTSVFSAGPKFELLAENATEEYTLSTIAVSKGQLFLRTEKHLYAIGKQ